MTLTTRIISILCALTTILSVRAQSGVLPPLTESADSTAIVSLLTCAPGNNIYELEGHSAVRMQYDGYDITANWGLFDFNSPNFVYRFVAGETDYCVGACPTSYFLEQYRRQGRRVTEQVLNLTPSQAARLIALIDRNLLPQNRTYRYNYVKDNCATRPLEIVEQAIGDTIRFAAPLGELGSAPTFRSVMRHYHANYPWYQFGIDLALGEGIDYPIDTRATAFAPDALQKLASDATISNDGNHAKPLVKTTNILVPGNAEGIAYGPTPWYATPITAAMALLLIVCLVTYADVRRHKTSRWLDTALYGLYGLMGCVIAFLVFISVHEATSPNYLLLWLNPLCLIPAITVWIARWRRLTYYYFTLNITAIIVYIISWWLGSQWVNAAFIPMILADAIRSLNYIYINSNALKKG